MKSTCSRLTQAARISVSRASRALCAARTLSAIAAMCAIAAIGMGETMGTAFTYQGYLASGGAEANGNHDFQFALYDAANGGSQVGVTVTKTDVAVASGSFTVTLDFGAGAFNGDARWLEIGVRTSGSGGLYTTLTPRQRLTPTPYALYAKAAEDAAALGGVPKSGFALVDHTHGGVGYANVIVVAKSGGVLTSIQAALDIITDNTEANPYLICVAPGTYQERVTMKPYVDIQGAGQNVIRILYGGSSLANTGTVVGASNAELRDVTVENSGGANYAIAIYNAAASPRITRVTALARSSSVAAYGVSNVQGAAPILFDMRITAQATGVTGQFIRGVSNEGASPEMTHLVITAQGGTGTNSAYGIWTSGLTAAPISEDLRVTVSGAAYDYGIWNGDNATVNIRNTTVSASGSVESVAIRNENTENVTLTNVNGSATAATATADTAGLYNYQASASIQNCVLSGAPSPATSSYGVFNKNAGAVSLYKVWINHSRIFGNTNTINTHQAYEVYCGATQLWGGDILPNDGLIRSIACYNENYQNPNGFTGNP